MPTDGSQRRPPPWRRLNLSYFGTRQRPHRESESVRTTFINDSSIPGVRSKKPLLNFRAQQYPFFAILKWDYTTATKWKRSSVQARHSCSTEVKQGASCFLTLADWAIIMEQRNISHHIWNLVFCFSYINKVWVSLTLLLTPQIVALSSPGCQDDEWLLYCRSADLNRKRRFCFMHYSHDLFRNRAIVVRSLLKNVWRHGSRRRKLLLSKLPVQAAWLFQHVYIKVLHH